MADVSAMTGVVPDLDGIIAELVGKRTTPADTVDDMMAIYEERRRSSWKAVGVGFVGLATAFEPLKTAVRRAAEAAQDLAAAIARGVESGDLTEMPIRDGSTCCPKCTTEAWSKSAAMRKRAAGLRERRRVDLHRCGDADAWHVVLRVARCSTRST